MDTMSDAVIEMVWRELERAVKKVPTWPSDPIHAVAVMVEESGEAMQAALDYYYLRGDLASLEAELVQTAAMCLRALLYSNTYRTREEL